MEPQITQVLLPERQQQPINTSQISLTSSMVENALADILLGEMQQPSEEVKRIGEEMIIDKIHSILDEVANKDKHVPEPQKKSLVSTSVQVIDPVY